MATPISLGTAKSKSRVFAWSGPDLLTANTTVPAVGDFAYQASLPSSNESTGVAVLALPTASGDDEVTNSIELGFFGTDADGETGEAFVWGLTEIEDYSGKYAGCFLGRFSFVLGPTFSSSGPYTGANHYFADEINTLNNYAMTPPGARPTGTAPAERGSIVLDTAGASHIVVRLVKVTAAGVGLTWRPF